MQFWSAMSQDGWLIGTVLQWQINTEKFQRCTYIKASSIAVTKNVYTQYSSFESITVTLYKIYTDKHTFTHTQIYTHTVCTVTKHTHIIPDSVNTKIYAQIIKKKKKGFQMKTGLDQGQQAYSNDHLQCNLIYRPK